MRRENLIQFDIVEEAIRLADKGLTSEAANMCRQNNIPIDVTHRVITKPKLRRNKDKFLKEKPEALWLNVKS